MGEDAQFAPVQRPRRAFGKRQPPNFTTTIAPPAAAPEAQITEQRAASGFPLFTVSLIALLAIVFAVELSLRQPGDKPLTPSLQTLFLMGASSRSAILEHGEWWRLFTAPLLHANLPHIASNCLALLLIGWQLERIIGFRWMAGIFAVSAISGSLATVALTPANTIGIGASGGIVGIFAAAVVAMLRMPRGRLRSGLTARAIYGLASSLLPVLGSHLTATNIDYAAHFGGAIGGTIASLLMLALWQKGEPQPEASPLAAGAAGLFFAIAAWSTVPATQLYTAQTTLLAPDWPADTADAEGRADQLLKTYPHDPRAMLVKGIQLLKRNDLRGAEASFRSAVAAGDQVRGLLPAKFELNVKVMLAATLYQEGQTIEAQGLTQPLCAELSQSMLADLRKMSLCLP